MLGPHDIHFLLMCFKNQSNTMKGETSMQQPSLTDLNIKDTNLSSEAGLYLTELLASNTTIRKILLDFNSNLSAITIDEINKACKRNREIQKQTRLPKAQRELDRLLEITGNGEDCTYEKRAAFNEEIMQIQKERKQTMSQVHEQETILQDLREEQIELQKEIKRQEKLNDDAMYALDKELRELNYVAKTLNQAQEDKLDNARAKIEICKFK